MPETETTRKQDVARLARGAGVLLPATLLGNVLLLGLDFYVNGVLGNAGYGVYKAVSRVMALAGFVTLLGMENAVIRYVAGRSREIGAGVARRAAGLVALTGAASAVVITATAGATSAWVDPSPSTALALQIAAISLPFAGVRMVAVAAAQGWGDVRPRATVLFLLWPAAQIVGVACLGGQGIRGVTAAYTSAMVLGAGVARVLAWRASRGADAGTRDPAREAPVPTGELLRFAWPLWLQGILMGLYTWSDQVLLAGLRSAEEAGIYGPVATITPIFGLGLGALNGMFAPMIAERVPHEGDPPSRRLELEALYRTVTRWAVILALPPTVFALARPELVIGLWPHGSMDAVPALRIATVSALVCTAVGSVNYLLIMAGQQRLVLWNGVPAVILNLLASYLLIPRYGPTGAALANGLAMMFANVVGFAQVRWALGISPFRRFGIGRAMVAAVAGGAVAAIYPAGHLASGLAGRWGDAAIASVLTLLVFCVVLAVLGLDDDDRVVVDAIRAKVRR